MSNNLFNYIFKVTSNAGNVTADMVKLRAGVDSVAGSANKMQSSFSAAFTKIQKDLNVIKLDAILNQVDRVATGLNAMTTPGLALNSSMQDLSAITGVAGQKLKEIEGYARENAKTFGGSAAQSVESYKLLLSQLSPELAKQPKALQAMGQQVSVLSKLMGGDSVAATEVLTTAINQYQVSLDDPIKASAEMARMMNIMAAAGKEGSAELPQIKQALEQAGLAAKTAGVDFSEANAAIQILDKAGKKGSEGGVALRNTLATLSQGRFLPKDVIKELQAAGVNVNTLNNQSLSLAERLNPLKKIMNDQALVTKLFGKENSNAAIALISGADEMQKLTGAINGTQSAYEQANKVMESQEEKNARLKAQVDDFKISMFNATGGAMGYASVIGDVSRDVGNLIPLVSGASLVIGTLTSKTKLLAAWTKVTTIATSIWSGVQAVFNAIMAMNPIVLVTLAIIALIGVIIWVASVTEGWGQAWEHTVNGAKLIFQAYVEAVKFYFSTMVNGIMIGLNYIKIGWYEFKNAVGIGDENENNAILAKIHADTEARKKAITDGAKKVKELGIAAAEEFAMAANSIKFKDNADGGISLPGIPGLGGTGMGTGDGDGTGGGTGGGTGNVNTAIATGGTKHNYITINLKELIGLKANTVTSGKKDAEMIGEQSLDQLLRLLEMAKTAGE
jgi:TP901 family phage tail tape measure protein